MKKLQILLPMAAVLLSLTGCKKDNEKSGPSGETVTLSATLGGGEKTEINGFSMTWSDGDAVNINGKEYFATFPFGYETANFEGVDVAPKYKAIYPADIYQGGDYVLPATQEYNGNTLSKINPMYAETETTSLQFHNICALVKLQVTGEGIVKKIVVTSTSNLCGTFTVSESNGKYYATISEGERSVTLKCGTGVALDPETPKTFYIALPEGPLFDLTFKCSGDDGVWTSQPIATANLTAGKLYTKTLENVEMKCVFSVDGDGNTVEFAPGNLWADATGETPVFYFETNQWGTQPASDGSWSENHVSHFFWSKNAKKAVEEELDWDVDDIFFTNDETFEVSGETAGTWRTLSEAEWDYLLNTRTNATNLRALVTLTDENVYGLVILPDGPDATASYVTTSALVSSCGAVFLPAAGYRNGTDVGYVGSSGDYWSSTPDGPVSAYGMGFNSGNVGTYSGSRNDGYAVRLVR